METKSWRQNPSKIRIQLLTETSETIPIFLSPIFLSKVFAKMTDFCLYYSARPCDPYLNSLLITYRPVCIVESLMNKSGIKAPETTRRKILHAAFEEFYRHGFQGGSLNHIVDTAGATKGALFHHFEGGKNDLGYAVVEEVIQPRI